MVICAYHLRLSETTSRRSKTAFPSLLILFLRLVIHTIRWIGGWPFLPYAFLMSLSYNQPSPKVPTLSRSPSSADCLAIIFFFSFDSGTECCGRMSENIVCCMLRFEWMKIFPNKGKITEQGGDLWRSLSLVIDGWRAGHPAAQGSLFKAYGSSIVNAQHNNREREKKV